MRAAGAAVAIVLLTAVVATRATSGAVLLIQAGPDLAGDAMDGLRFGIAEANRTASLLGKSVRLGKGALSTPMIAGASSRLVHRGPLLVLQPDDGLDQPSADCVFALSPPPGAMDAILKEWLAQHPSTSAAGGALTAWDPRLHKFGASELNDRYLAAMRRPMTSPAWLGWAAVKVLAEAWLSGSGPLTCHRIGAQEFDGHKGAVLHFDQATRILKQPWYVVAHSQILGEAFTDEREGRRHVRDTSGPGVGPARPE